MNLLDAKSLINDGGFAVLLAIIFAETGLLIGFFLPGDTLLFLAGAVTVKSAKLEPAGIVMVAGMVSCPAPRRKERVTTKALVVGVFRDTRKLVLVLLGPSLMV